MKTMLLAGLWFLLGTHHAVAQISRASGVKENRAFIYHGKLVRPDGSTPTGSASVTVKITSPDPSMCVLWAESQTVKLDNGSFAMELGHTVNRVSGASGGAASSFKQVFINNAGLTHSSATCASGNSYTPTAADDRLLFAMFNDGGAVVEIAGLPIKSVPFALQAEEIGGYGLSNLVKISGAGSSVVFTPNEVQSLSDMLGGDINWNMKNRRVTGVAAPTAPTDAVNKGHLDAALAAISLTSSAITTALGYTPLNKSGDSMTGVLGLHSVSSTPFGLGVSDAGKMWFDSNTGEIKFWNGTNAVALGLSGGGLTSIGLSAPSIFSVTGSPLTANGTITLSLASQSANRVFASPDGSAGAPTFRALAASDVPSLDAAKISTGTFTASQIPSLDTSKITTGVLGVARGGTGLAPAAGDANKVYGVNSAGTGSEFKNITGVGTVSVSHSAGGILITGAGDGAGTVTSVGVGGLPLSVTNGTTTPTLSIAQANTTTAGYLSSTDWNAFNNKQGTSLTQDNVWVGNGSNVATAKLLRISDIKANTTGNPSFLNASGACTAGLALGYNSVTDRLECAAYSLTSSQVTTALGFTPADSINAVLKGGNAGAFSIGTTNSNPLSIIANSATAMTVLANGNVGIGTTSPAGRLQVTSAAGTSSTAFSGAAIELQRDEVSSPTTGGYIDLKKNAADDFRARIYHDEGLAAGNGALTFAVNTDGTSYLNRMAITGTGNVGIGTTSPGDKLEVIGNIKGTQLCIGTDCRSSWPTGSGGTVTGVSSANADIAVANGSTTPYLTLNSGTSGGAGDANKIAKLDASGLLTTAMLPNHSASKITSGTLAVAQGGTGSGTALNNNRLMISSGGNIVEASAIAGNRAVITNASGIPIASAVTDTELGYVSGLTSSAQTQLNGKQASNTELTGLAGIALTGILQRTGAGTYTALGTTSPLTVTGGNIAMMYTPVNKAGDTMTGALNLPSNGLAVGASQLVVSGGYIGVGTTSPGNRLEVINKVHDASVPSEYVMAVTNAHNTTSKYGLIVGTNWGAAENFVANFGTYNAIGGAYTSFMAIKGNGFIGIGTTTPSEKVEVNGAFYSSPTAYNAGNFLAKDSSGTKRMLIGVSSSPLDSTVLQSAGGGINFRDSALTTKMYMSEAGNVGIGTTSPAEKLEVVGNVKGTQLCIGSDCRSSWPSGGGGTFFAEVDSILMSMMLSDSLGSPRIFTNSFVDSFNVYTYVNTGGATNLATYDAGVLQPSAPSPGATAYANAGGTGNRSASVTVTSNVTIEGGTTPLLVDGTTTGSQFNPYNNIDAGTYFQFDFGAGVFKYIDEVKIYCSANPAAGTWEIQGSVDGTNWTVLQAFNWNASTVTVPISTQPALNSGYRYYRVYSPSSVSAFGSTYMNEFEFKVVPGSTSALNMTAPSAAITASAVPSTGKLVARVEYIDSITLGTDLIFEISRDNGTTWSAATMTSRGSLGGVYNLESNSVSLTGQPSGTSMKYRVRTLNSKRLKVHDVFLGWQ